MQRFAAPFRLLKILLFRGFTIFTHFRIACLAYRRRAFHSLQQSGHTYRVSFASGKLVKSGRLRHFSLLYARIICR